MDKFKLFEVLLDEDLNVEISTDVDIDAMIKGMMVLNGLTRSVIKAFIDCNEKSRISSFILWELATCSLLSYDDPYEALEECKTMILETMPHYEESARKLREQGTKE